MKTRLNSLPNTLNLDAFECQKLKEGEESTIISFHISIKNNYLIYANGISTFPHYKLV